ncbi:hypothetical protein POJ06DRAFT_287420 [Lipomyces tetrasporus]|uniref:Uncharacterized protein n=1 Tax=Lipomyces tetrasporus TaxID=54092 RepID=A0AAD7VP22_9ASCO|nr:uncharacterized protein POJ06DRAFT_287420 [Lipomyces tetrasporus]KAJ8096518.1 hypothetical protein POJ06DRAFT_287420 [Lipomyces tetrasporus]
MADSELFATVRRPLSPDTQIEIRASRSEYQIVQDILEEEDVQYPRLQYDGARKVAIVSAAPTPLHGEMVGQLLSKIYGEVMTSPLLNANIRSGLSVANDMRNTEDTGDTSTTRNWDGALRYLTEEETGPSHILMIAIEVGLAQTHASLRAAISFSVWNHGTGPSPKYYTAPEEKRAAVQEAEHVIRSQLRAYPFGPLKIAEDTWFGKITSVVLETYRLEDETQSPDTLLDPTQSFTIVDDGRFVGGEVPSNLAEITLGDCIPTHILSGNNIEATAVNFFHRDWFERSFCSAMFQTAIERIKDKCQVQRV